MEWCSLLSNKVYFLMPRHFGNNIKLVHSLTSCVPADLQLSHNNHYSWLLESAINASQLAPYEKLNWIWKPEESASDFIPYRQHRFTPLCFSQDPLWAVQEEALTFTGALSCAVQMSISPLKSCYSSSLHSTFCKSEGYKDRDSLIRITVEDSGFPYINCS